MNGQGSPLRLMERYGVTAPDALKKVHAPRHNNDEGTHRPNTNPQENRTMSNNNAAAAENTEAPVAEAPAAAEAAPAPTLVEASLSPDSTPEQVKIALEVKQPEVVKKTKMQKVGETTERVATIAGGVALGLLIVEGGKAAISAMFSGDDLPTEG